MRATGKIGDRVRYNRSYNKYFGNGAGDVSCKGFDERENPENIDVLVINHP